MCENMMTILSDGLSKYLDKLLDSNKNDSNNNLVKIE